MQCSDNPVTESSGHGCMDHPSMMAGSQRSSVAISSSSLNLSSMSDTPTTSMGVLTSKVQPLNDLSEMQLSQPTLESKTPFTVSPQNAADKGEVQHSYEPDTESSGTLMCGSNNSSSLKIVGSQSCNSADSSPHLSSVSRQSTPMIDGLSSMVPVPSGCEMRRSISSVKTLHESHFQPTADGAHSDKLLPASCDSGTHQNNIAGNEHDCETREGVEYECHIGKFNAKDNTRQVPKELRPSKSSNQPEDIRQERSRSAQRYSNSEDESSESPNVVPKAKHRCRSLLPKKEKRKNVADNQSVTDSKVPYGKNYQQNTSKTGIEGKKAEVKRESVTVLKAKAEVHYPGYSSGWSSSSDSEMNKNIIVTTQGSEEKENQLSNSSSVKSTISTSSWTSSEEDDKEKQLQQKSSSKPSDLKSVRCGVSVDLPGYERMFNKECCETRDSRKITEQTEDSIPLALDSEDMEMEPQAHGGSQQQDGSATDVTVISETQEVLSDVGSMSNFEVVAEQLGSPVIPLQNYLKVTQQDSALNGSIPCCQENQAGSCVPSSNTKSRTSAVLPAGNDKSDNRTRKQKRKRLLEKIKKRHPRHRFSDMGDSASSAESRRIDSCLRRKVRLSAKEFNICCMKKQSNRQKGQSKCTSDSEFVCPSSRRLTSLSRRSTTIQKSVSVSVDEKVKRIGKRSEEAPMSTDKQRSKYPECEPSDRMISKQERKVDHALSPKSVSKPIQSQSPNGNELNLKQHAVTKKANLRKKTAKEVIKFSSDSEPDFEPPPFKKRKPCPNFSQPRKQKTILLDKMYSSAEVHNVPSKLSTEEKLKYGSESSTENGSDLEVTCEFSVSKQHPLTVKGQYQGTTNTGKENALAQSKISTEHSLEIADLFKSSGDNTKEEFEASVHTTDLKIDGNFSSNQNSAVAEGKSQSAVSDTSSSDLSNGDGATNWHLKKGTADSLSRNHRISDSTKATGSLKCSKMNSSSSSSSSDEEPDSVADCSTTNEANIDKTGRPLDRTAQAEKSLSSLPRPHEIAVNVCGTPLPKQELELKLTPVPCVDSELKKVEENSSESSDEVEDTGLSSKPTFLSQPLQEGISQQSSSRRSMQSSDKKLLPDKSSLSKFSSVRRPPRFLFSRSSVKKNVPRQLHELKKSNNKPKGSYESENSTGRF